MEVLRLINTFMKKVGISKYTYSNNDKKWNAAKYWLRRIYWPPSNLQNSSFFLLLFDVDVWVLKYVGAHFPRNLLERKQVNLMVFAINTRNRSNDCIRRNGPKRKYFRYFWKCNFPMNHSVCLSVGRSVCLSTKSPNYSNVIIINVVFF